MERKVDRLHTREPGGPRPAGDTAPRLRYDRRVRDLGGLGESHAWLISRVPDGATVLDCGCAGGYVARPLVARGCTVDGVELDPEAAQQARGVCRRVHAGSIEDESVLAGIEPLYDRILLGDILEHLREPDRVLRRLADRLKPGGRVLVAVPNVAHWSVRWALLKGRFDYTDYGLLDRTHLRFFTFHSARQLAEHAGYRILAADVTCVLPPIRRGRPLVRRFFKKLPNLFGYQTLLELEPWSG